MEEDDVLRKKVNEIYTPLSVAKEEIWRRWNNKELRKKVEDFLGGDMPEVFKKEPRAVLTRYIITPNYEFFYFLDLANLIGLNHVCFEYSNDKFVAKNPDKYNLCKMIFNSGHGKHNGIKLENINIVNFNKNEGKKLTKIKTIWNENLIDFHHKILYRSVSGLEKRIFDVSEWFNSKRNKDKNYYYLYYLALFLCHGVLFENFLLNKNETEFTSKKVLPSFNELEKIFRIRPLIVPLEPRNNELACSWRHYSKNIKKLDEHIIIKK